MHPVDEAVALYAQDHWGTFSYRKARELGASRTFIARRLEQDRWLRFAEGSLGLPGWPASFARSMWKASNAARPGSIVGGWSAAALYNFTGFPRNRLELLVRHGTRHDNPIALVRQTRRWPEKIETVEGFEVPTRERVVCEVARQVGPKRLGRAVDDLLVAQKISLPRLQTMFLSLAAPRWPGLKVMGAVLASRSEEYVPTRSELEREMRRIIATIEGVEVSFEKQIGDPIDMRHQVDCVIESPVRLIVETDGRTWHERREQMARDRQRDRRALALGYPTHRYVYEEVVHRREDVRNEIIDYVFSSHSLGASQQPQPLL